MFLNKTTEYLLDDEIVKVLIQKKCPIVVYRLLSQFIPKNSKNIPLLKYDLKFIIHKRCQIEEMSKRFILNTNISKSQRDFCLKNLLTYRQIIRSVLLVAKEKCLSGGTSPNWLVSNKIMTMACYVKIRYNLPCRVTDFNCTYLQYKSVYRCLGI